MTPTGKMRRQRDVANRQYSPCVGYVIVGSSVSHKDGHAPDTIAVWHFSPAVVQRCADAGASISPAACAMAYPTALVADVGRMGAAR